ncbi:MAG: alpha-glucan family phosphorylase [Pyrinomonadaceae bacterium]
MLEAEKDIATQAVSPQTANSFRQDFELNRDLPDNLQALGAISANFYWSWQPDGTALFRDLDPRLWEKCEQNPRLFLDRISGLRLWQKAGDAEYLERLRTFSQKFENYLSTDHRPLTTDRSIAYFCAEYGVHNSLPNYSGGLGILAGDHLKSASDLNLPLNAIGLLYRYGYFRQKLGHDGWQQESYNDVFESELAVTPVMDGNGSRITVAVHIRGRVVTAQAWLAQVGRIRLYLLDTNIPQNAEVDQLITGHLYGGDVETRIVQEKVLGIGGVRLLRKLGISPDVYHLNEGHAAFSTLELASEYLAANSDKNFADAIEYVRSRCVFTTHTPVAAGNDLFPPDTLNECFSREFIDSLKLTGNEFLSLGRVDLTDDAGYFGMTPLAIRMCRSANGVSEKHGEVSRELWQQMFPDLKTANEVPITHVTNGVHAPTWIAPVFQTLYRSKIGESWNEQIREPQVWSDFISTFSDEEIWSSHSYLKNLLVAYIRQRTRAKFTGEIDTIHEHSDTEMLFSPDFLTIGFARRVAKYKRWDLLFTDLERLLKLVDDVERPVQFVFAGKAHPQDNTAKNILQELMSINHDSNWQRRAVFIEDYDQEIARYLVHGVDVWMNVPRRPMEASGTSGMKAAMNGVLNFSILDGWWIEGYNEKNGFAIGDWSRQRPVGDEHEVRKALTNETFAAPVEDTDLADAESLYQTLETQIIPKFYNKNEAGLPVEWIAMMRNSIATLTPQFASDRMVRDYLEKIYKS